MGCFRAFSADDVDGVLVPKRGILVFVGAHAHGASSFLVSVFSRIHRSMQTDTGNLAADHLRVVQRGNIRTVALTTSMLLRDALWSPRFRRSVHNGPANVASHWPRASRGGSLTRIGNRSRANRRPELRASCCANKHLTRAGSRGVERGRLARLERKPRRPCGLAALPKLTVASSSLVARFPRTRADKKAGGTGMRDGVPPRERLGQWVCEAGAPHVCQKASGNPPETSSTVANQPRISPAGSGLPGCPFWREFRRR